MYQYGEARFAGKQREGGLFILLDGVISVAVPSLPAVALLLVTLSEEEVFIKSEGLSKCRCCNDVSTSVPKRPRLMVFLWSLGRLDR